MNFIDPNSPPASGNPSSRAPSPGGFVIRQKEPVNLEMPFSALDGFVTPNARFYVRSHFPVPHLDAGTWRLRVEGAVAEPFELTYDELLKMETRTATATLECAGNGRAFLVPQVKGAQWGLGAVGNAEWTGVPLAALLARTGVAAGAVEVILEGADEGEIDDPPRPGGKFRYSRSLPLPKALDDVLLATRMNGEPLPPNHGFPLRAVVPGWFGMASVKWLRRVIVTATPYAGYFQSVDYSYWQRQEGLPTLVPITELQVKAQIAWPDFGEVVPAGATVRARGAAWSGAGSEIVKVEFSPDGGTTWQEAQLLGEPVKNAWRLWECPWQTPAAAGKQILMARATDSRGRTQSSDRDADRGSYIINHLLPIEVEVR